MSYLLTMFKYLCSHYQAHGEFSVSTFVVYFINVNKILNQCPSKISSFSVLTGTKSHRWSPFFALPKQGCLRKQFFIDLYEMWLFLCQFRDFLIDHTDICLCCVPLNWLCVKSASWQLFDRASQENWSAIACFRRTLLHFGKVFESSVKTTCEWHNSMCDNCGGCVDKLWIGNRNLTRKYLRHADV